GTPTDRGGGGERSRRAEEQRVAVRLRARDRLRADGAARPARTIFDNEGLPEHGRQPIRKEADDEFRRPTWHERHDDLDRAVRIDLRRSERPEVRRKANRQQDFASREELLAAHGAASLVSSSCCRTASSA